MKSRKLIIFISILVLFTAVAVIAHLSAREQIPEHSVKITMGDQEYIVDITTLDYEKVSGIRVNGKGEEIPVEGDGIALSKLLSQYEIIEFSKVTIVSDDSYSAIITKDEVEEKDRAYFLMVEDSLRLVVFGDENSKRSVSNVVQIQVQ